MNRADWSQPFIPAGVNANDDVDSNNPAFNNAGLARVSYTIAAGNIGTTCPLAVDAQGKALTAIATFDGIPYDVTLVGGSITVAAIPEPGSFALRHVREFQRIHARSIPVYPGDRSSGCETVTSGATVK